MDKSSQIAIWGIAITILVPITVIIMQLIMSPRVKFTHIPKRDYRPWVDLSESSPYDALLTAGTASMPQVKYLYEKGKLPQQRINIRYYIFMPISNDSNWRFKYSTAKDVHAELIFYNIENKRVGEFKGRWQSKKQPRFLEDKAPLLNIDIQAGNAENLDIASKKMTNSAWYVMNNDNYDKPDDSEIQENRIGVGGFVVHIKLDGENIDPEEVIYKVIDNGNDEPTYIKLDSI